MTDTEWVEFTFRLFVEYPSLNDRLKRSAVDYKATLVHWRKKLSRYTAAELNAVLDKWEAENAVPWDSWALEQAPNVIANVASKARDKKSEREKVGEMVNDPRSPRRRQTMDGDNVGFSILTGSMVDAYRKLSPLYAKMEAGEITVTEYTMEKEKEFAKL